MFDRVPRYTSTCHKQSEVISDADIIIGLQRMFSAFDTASQSNVRVNAQAYSVDSCDSRRLTEEITAVELKDDSVLRHRWSRNVDMMLQSCGFTVERRPSTLKRAGTGVLVTGGAIPAGVVTSLYPGMILYLQRV